VRVWGKRVAVLGGEVGVLCFALPPESGALLAARIVGAGRCTGIKSWHATSDKAMVGVRVLFISLPLPVQPFG
jgi:hypothetical protein